jgi:hypothetical protein
VVALENQLIKTEQDVTAYLRERGVYNGTDPFVSSEQLTQLFQDPNWAGVQVNGAAPAWLDPEMARRTHLAAMLNYGIAYVYSKLSRPGYPTEGLVRATALEPYGQFNMPNTQQQQQPPQTTTDTQQTQP